MCAHANLRQHQHAGGHSETRFSLIRHVERGLFVAFIQGCWSKLKEDLDDQMDLLIIIIPVLLGVQVKNYVVCDMRI